MGRAAPAPGPSDPNVNTSAHVQVLASGTDAGDAVPSALLFFDRRRLLFNAGEGFQRYATEHGVRLGRLTDVLLTRVTPDAAGGLPGLCMSLADLGRGGPPVRVVGPPGLAALASALRTFVDTRVSAIEPAEVGGGVEGAPTGRAVALPPVVDDGVVTITPVLLVPPQAESVGGDVTGGSGGEDADEVGGEPQRKRARPAPGPPPDPASLALCYVCELAPIPGKFLPAAAIAAGVRPGPLFGQLKAGRAVQAADGRWVQPDEVVQPAAPGPVAIVADAPGRAHAALLRDAVVSPDGALARWAASPHLAAVVHLAHADVVGTPAYAAFAAALRCGSGGGGGGGASPVDHLFVNEAATGGEGVLQASAALAARLHTVHPGLFPLHRVGVAAAYDDDEGGEGPGRAAAAGLLPGGTPGRNLTRCHLRPRSKAGVDESSVPPRLDVDAIQAAVRAEHGPLLADAAAAWDAAAAGPRPPALAAVPPGAVTITFLGTGAALPSKYRNVSGTLVRVDGGAAGLLLDCGEGTLGQLRRRFGAAGTRAALRGLAAVWISHIHADHHAGLPGLLLARAAAAAAAVDEGEGGGAGPAPAPPPPPPRLLVIGPRPLRRVLAAYARLYEGMAYHFVDCADVEDGRAPAAGADADAVTAALAALRSDRLATVRVDHCAHAFGLVLDARVDEGGPAAGRPPPARARLAFSGDTRPCPAVAAAAAGAALLVHEATFEDGLAAEAVAKKHSTTGDAVQAGVDAGAARTVLTHFSQRYPKIPLLQPGLSGSVGIAFDLLSLDLADAVALPALSQPLRILFEAMEEKGGGDGTEKEE